MKNMKMETNISYSKLSKIKQGRLINFNVKRLMDGLKKNSRQFNHELSTMKCMKNMEMGINISYLN